MARAVDPIHGASTQQRDTLTSRSHAATIFWARIRGRSPLSEGISNATVRILSDDPGPFEGLAATLRSRLAIGYPCGLTTATETSRLCPPRDAIGLAPASNLHKKWRRLHHVSKTAADSR